MSFSWTFQPPKISVCSSLKVRMNNSREKKKKTIKKWGIAYSVKYQLQEFLPYSRISESDEEGQRRVSSNIQAIQKKCLITKSRMIKNRKLPSLLDEIQTWEKLNNVLWVMNNEKGIHKSNSRKNGNDLSKNFRQWGWLKNTLVKM